MHAESKNRLTKLAGLDFEKLTVRPGLYDEIKRDRNTCYLLSGFGVHTAMLLSLLLCVRMSCVCCFRQNERNRSQVEFT